MSDLGKNPPIPEPIRDHTRVSPHTTVIAESADGQPPRRRHRRIWLGIGGVLLVAVASAAVYVSSLPRRVPANTYVNGIAVGNLPASRLDSVLEGDVRADVERDLTITAGGKTVTVAPADLGITFDHAGTASRLLGGSSLSERLPQFGGSRTDVTPKITVDDATVQTVLKQKLAPVLRTPKNATIEPPAPRPRLEEQGDASFQATSIDVDVTPGRTGQTVDLKAARKSIVSAVTTGRTAITLTVTKQRPKVTTADLEGIDQLIGTFTTRHPCCAPRVTNIHRIAQIVDDTMVMPGEEFSLNDKVGRRTTQNGFVHAPAISEGELVQQVGGGVSQFSTTLFNATWFSGLPTLTHQPHSKYISRYPPGREATLDYDSIDQVFKNNTDTPVVIRTATTSTSVTVALYGHTGDRTVISATSERVPRAKGEGFSISVTRTVADDGQVTGNDTLHWTYSGFD